MTDVELLVSCCNTWKPLTVCKWMNSVELVLDSNTWDHLSVYKQVD